METRSSSPSASPWSRDTPRGHFGQSAVTHVAEVIGHDGEPVSTSQRSARERSNRTSSVILNHALVRSVSYDMCFLNL